MKKYTIYQDDRAGCDRVAIRITKPTENNKVYTCIGCNRPFKKHERVLKLSFRFLAPRLLCSGCAHEKLTEAIQALGRIHKKGKGFRPDSYPEWFIPKKHISDENDGDIPF